MTISSASLFGNGPVTRPAGIATAKASGSQASVDTQGDFLKYAKMSPMDRMRAGILKSMDLTEEQLGALPQDARQKVEDQIKDSIRKMVSNEGPKGQLIDISA
jgi:hypothetical protein